MDDAMLHGVAYRLTALGAPEDHGVAAAVKDTMVNNGAVTVGQHAHVGCDAGAVHDKGALGDDQIGEGLAVAGDGVIPDVVRWRS